MTSDTLIRAFNKTHPAGHGCYRSLWSISLRVVLDLAMLTAFTLICLLLSGCNVFTTADAGGSSASRIAHQDEPETIRDRTWMIEVLPKDPKPVDPPVLWIIPKQDPGRVEPKLYMPMAQDRSPL